MHGDTLDHCDLLHNPSAVEPWPADQLRKSIPFFNQLFIDSQLIDLIKIQYPVNEFKAFIAVAFLEPKTDTNVGCFTVYLCHFRYLRILFVRVVLLYTGCIDPKIPRPVSKSELPSMRPPTRAR